MQLTYAFIPDTFTTNITAQSSIRYVIDRFFNADTGYHLTISGNDRSTAQSAPLSYQNIFYYPELYVEAEQLNSCQVSLGKECCDSEVYFDFLTNFEQLGNQGYITDWPLCLIELYPDYAIFYFHNADHRIAKATLKLNYDTKIFVYTSGHRLDTVYRITCYKGTLQVDVYDKMPSKNDNPIGKIQITSCDNGQHHCITEWYDRKINSRNLFTAAQAFCCDGKYHHYNYYGLHGLELSP